MSGSGTASGSTSAGGPPSERIYYFGYGSNMGIQSLQKRKVIGNVAASGADEHLPGFAYERAGVPGTNGNSTASGSGPAQTPATSSRGSSSSPSEAPESTELRTVPAVLQDYALTFDYPGIPLVEPSFGNIRETVKRENSTVHGVLIEMTRAEFDRKIIETEGEVYRVLEVEVDVYNVDVYSPATEGLRRNGNARTMKKVEKGNPALLRDVERTSSNPLVDYVRRRGHSIVPAPADRPSAGAPAPGRVFPLRVRALTLHVPRVDLLRDWLFMPSPRPVRDRFLREAKEATRLKRQGSAFARKVADLRYIAPSKRYVDLLRTGAREQKLQPDYTAWLEQLPSSEERLTLVGWVLSAFFVRPMFGLVYLLIMRIFVFGLGLSSRKMLVGMRALLLLMPFFWPVMLLLWVLPDWVLRRELDDASSSSKTRSSSSTTRTTALFFANYKT
eukprot:g2568.t1